MNSSEPILIYGTAWKELKTEELTELALSSGFRAIDTANQRKHYYEEGVGSAIQSYLKKSGLNRADLFLQTKFTYEGGQDHRLPYDPRTSISNQVIQSFSSSLSHLQTEYIDSYLLHGPMYSRGIHQEDMEAWAAMEELYRMKKALAIGISNVTQDQLIQLYENSYVKPAYVQNRCYAKHGWDFEVRSYCKKMNIKYQGFSLLTANVQAISSDPLAHIAIKYKKTLPQIIFRFCYQSGIICLTGTTNPVHMKEDLDIFSFELNQEEIHDIETAEL